MPKDQTRQMYSRIIHGYLFAWNFSYREEAIELSAGRCVMMIDVGLKKKKEMHSNSHT